MANKPKPIDKKYDECQVDKKSGKVLKKLRVVSITKEEAELQSEDWKTTGIKMVESK